jgi:type II secretory pathway component PulF
VRYRSTILDEDGSTVQAVLEAEDEQALHASLHDEGKSLVRVVPIDPIAKNAKIVDMHLPPRRLLMLTQALYEALDAGVPLLSTFEAIADQEDDPKVAALLDDLAAEVAAGQSLSDALEDHPQAFPGIYCALVRAGEHSGNLPEVMNSMASFLEWRIDIASTVKQAMVYPIIVGMAGYGMVLFMLSFVIPRLSDVLNKISDDLPAASVMLINSSDFVASNIIMILMGSVGAFIAFYFLLSTAGFKTLVMNVLGRLPIARNVVITLAIAQFARTFSVLLNSGLTMTNAMHLGGASVSYPDLRDRIEAARERILGGARLAEALEAEEVLAPVAMSMVQVGEEAGRLPVTFDRLGRLYDREVKDAVKKALSMLEPLVTVLLGVVVGGVAVLVVMTIYSAMNGIGK